jgi:hypothetical protein
LSNKSQKLLLDTLAARPDDTDLTGNLDQLVSSSAFRKLDERVREVVLRHIKAYGGDRQRIDNVQHTITATVFFESLAEPVQKQLIRTVLERPDDTELADELTRAVDGNLNLSAANIDFRDFKEDLQLSVIEQIKQSPNLNATYVEGLLALAGDARIGGDAKIAGLPPEVRDDVLSSLPGSGLGLSLGGHAIADNVVDLASDQPFQQTPRELRLLMLELLGARPENARLVSAFKSSVGTPGFNNDHRNGRKRVFDADSSIRD